MEWFGNNKGIFIPEELYDKLMETKLIYNRKRKSKVSVGVIVALLLSNDTIVSEIFNQLQ